MSLLLRILVIAGVILVWAGVGVWLPYLVHSSSQGNRGTFGDQFGAVNALFTGLAFAGILITLREADRQHRRELALQVILNVLTEIRSKDWRQAHGALASWHREGRQISLADFKRDRGTPASDAAKLDEHRAVFMTPFHKVWRLYKADVVVDKDAEIIVDANYAGTLLKVLWDLEREINPKHGDDKFEWIERLYPPERLKAEGFPY